MSDKTSEELRAEIAQLEIKLNEALEEIKKLNQTILTLKAQAPCDDFSGFGSRWLED